MTMGRHSEHVTRRTGNTRKDSLPLSPNHHITTIYLKEEG